MKIKNEKIYIVYAADGELKFENGGVLITGENSMALEFTNPSDISKALKLFPEQAQAAR